MASDQTGISGRGGSPDGHYHDGSWYRDSECKCALSNPKQPVFTPEQITEAYRILCAVTAHAARGALSQGLSPDDVAQELESLADAIRDPGSVAENMYAIPQIPAEQWEYIGVNFSEVG